MVAMKMIYLEEQKSALLVFEKVLNFSSWEGIILLLAKQIKKGSVNKMISIKIQAFHKPTLNSGMKDIFFSFYLSFPSEGLGCSIMVYSTIAGFTVMVTIAVLVEGDNNCPQLLVAVRV